MKKFLSNFRQSEFSKNTFTLISGNSIAQIIPFAAEPVLSRIFTPAEFGIFEIYAAVIMILGVVSTARYELAIVLPRLDNKAINVLWLSVGMVVVFTLVSLLIIWMGQEGFLNFPGMPEYGKILYYIPLGIFLIGMNRSFMYWALRNKQVKFMSLASITESFTKAVSSISLGLVNLSFLGLILGQLLGKLFSVVVLIFNAIRRDAIKAKFISAKTALKQARIYAEFPTLNVPLALTEILQFSGIIFVFSFFFDNSEVGQFSKALRIMVIPLNLLATSITQVLYQKTSDEYLKGINLEERIRKITRTILIWSIPSVAVFALISPWLFGFVLGPVWTTAGEYGRILACWVAVKFITSPASIIPLVINKQKEYFILNLMGTILLLGAVIIPGMLNVGIIQILIILSISQSLFLGYLYYRIMNIYRDHWIKRPPGSQRANQKD